MSGQQSVNPQHVEREVAGKRRRKVPKPYAVEYRTGRGAFLAPKDWREWSRYRSADAAEQALEKLRRSCSFWEWRLSPDNPRDDA